MDAILTVNTVAAPMAAGQSAGQFKVSSAMADGSQPQTNMFDAPVPTTNPDGTANDTPPLVVTFSGIAAGDWVVTASRVDQNGADIATAVTKGFNVAATAAGTTQVPGTITFT